MAKSRAALPVFSQIFGIFADAAEDDERDSDVEATQTKRMAPTLCAGAAMWDSRDIIMTRGVCLVSCLALVRV